jgi:hypothetical protein
MSVDGEAEVRNTDAGPGGGRARAAAGTGLGGPGRGPPALAAYGWRVRRAAGFGLVRTGLRLLDGGRA